jgi:hypothetical protein
LETAGTSTAAAQLRAKKKKVGQSARENSASGSIIFMGRLRESHSSGPDATTIPSGSPAGRRFKVTLLQEGLGNFEDAYYYTAECIESAVPIFEGKKLFVDHPDAIEEEVRPERSIRDVGGYFENLTAERDSDGRMCLVGDLVTLDSPDIEPIRARMVEAVKYAIAHPGQELIGLSINAGGDFDKVGLEQFMRETAIPEVCKAKLQEAIQRGVQVIRPVRRMTFANSCDLVTEAGAGGRISEILEHQRGTMSTKAKGKQVTDEKDKNKPAALKESEGEAKSKAKEGEGGDSGHADADDDEELIKSLMKKHLGDGFTEDDHAMAKEAYENAMEACEGDHAEAEKMAGYSMKMARHMKQKEGKKAVNGGAAPDENDIPAKGPAEPSVPHKDQVSEADETPKGVKESAKGGSADLTREVARLAGENAKLTKKIEELELTSFIETTLKESKLPFSATKKFRECIKEKKTKKEVSDAFAVFKEAFQSAGESDGMGLIIGGEKATGGSGAGLSFEDCTND